LEINLEKHFTLLNLWIETYVGVYIYKSYNKGGFNSASVGLKLINWKNMFLSYDVNHPVQSPFFIWKNSLCVHLINYKPLVFKPYVRYSEPSPQAVPEVKPQLWTVLCLYNTLVGQAPQTPQV
jgi:hypothetical protein